MIPLSPILYPRFDEEVARLPITTTRGQWHSISSLAIACGGLRVNTKKVRILMIERGLRNIDLARAWNVTDAAVAQVIKGKRPTSLLLGKLAKALRVKLQDILLNGNNVGDNDSRRAA